MGCGPHKKKRNKRMHARTGVQCRWRKLEEGWRTNPLLTASSSCSSGGDFRSFSTLPSLLYICRPLFKKKSEREGKEKPWTGEQASRSRRPIEQSLYRGGRRLTDIRSRPSSVPRRAPYLRRSTAVDQKPCQVCWRRRRSALVRCFASFGANFWRLFWPTPTKLNPVKTTVVKPLHPYPI